mmetsp:Transcript_21885/g.67411  ORF Transcript_21885/g.67411 Transcript_21885/m.67411 type:complete len:223 (+) Transcript_21885:244-912(+)
MPPTCERTHASLCPPRRSHRPSEESSRTPRGRRTRGLRATGDVSGDASTSLSDDALENSPSDASCRTELSGDGGAPPRKNDARRRCRPSVGAANARSRLRQAAAVVSDGASRSSDRPSENATDTRVPAPRTRSTRFSAKVREVLRPRRGTMERGRSEMRNASPAASRRTATRFLPSRNTARSSLAAAAENMAVVCDVRVDGNASPGLQNSALRAQFEQAAPA